jgi:hypothetical protein
MKRGLDIGDIATYYNIHDVHEIENSENKFRFNSVCSGAEMVQVPLKLVNILRNQWEEKVWW